jgi:ankyrin repeat protein
MTALLNAAWQGHAETVRVLLDRGADPNLTGNMNRTALDYARMGTRLISTRAESREIVRMLEKAGAKANGDG